MTEHSPITPPQDLTRKWMEASAGDYLPDEWYYEMKIATQAARWGADQELEACCEWLASETPEPYINALRAARRPKPPSLKEQALEALQSIKSGGVDGNKYMEIMLTLEKALEALPDD